MPLYKAVYSVLNREINSERPLFINDYELVFSDVIDLIDKDLKNPKSKIFGSLYKD